MPKIGKKYYTIDGTTTEFEIHYSKGNGFYIKNFPKGVTELLEEFESQHFPTETELYRSYGEKLKKYHEMTAKRIKVIAYTLSLPVELLLGETSSSYGHGTELADYIPKNAKFKQEGWTGYGFNLKHRILFQTFLNGKNVYNEICDDGTIGSGYYMASDTQVISYTPEREQFFLELKEATKDMVVKMLNFFAQDENKLLSVFDTGTIKGNLLN